MKNIIIITQDLNYFEKLLNHQDASEFELIAIESESKLQSYIAQKGSPSMILLDEECVLDVEETSLYLKRIVPQSIRVILKSAEMTDLNECALSNERAVVCQKIMKHEHLWESIQRIIKLYSRIQNPEILDIMASIQHIPTVPDMYYKLNYMIKSQASMEEIAKEIEKDPAVASNILKLANTAFYSAKTGSIRQAMMYIGLNNIRNIILTNAVFGSDGLAPNVRAVHWEHACKTNLILNIIYKELLGKKLDNQFSAVGLLHDIGSIVLMRNYPIQYNAIVKNVESDTTLNFKEEEKKVLKIEHDQVGGYLLELWGLPLPMIEATLMHHDPMNPEILYRELVCAVHLAHYISWKIMQHPKKDNELDLRVLEVLGITQEMLENLVVSLKDQVEES